MLEKGDDFFYVGNVGLDGDCISTLAEGLDLLDNLLCGVCGVGVVDNDLGTATGEFERRF